jgi:hypothetical protein
MLTVNTIIEEIKGLPSDHLSEVHEFIKSLRKKSKMSEKNKKEVLSMAGILSDWSEEEYQDFVQHTQKIRKELFTRKFDL